MNAATVGAGAGIAVVFLLIGLFFHKCPLDGNPVGFHINGTVILGNASAFDLSKCGSSCTLTFDLRTDENAAATAVTCASGANCVHFNDNGKDKLTVKITTKDPERTFYDHVDGTVTFAP
ncbi:MAG TPA: hypothetical protein VIW73_14305 [Candidatus Cybelea sp.]